MKEAIGPIAVLRLKTFVDAARVSKIRHIRCEDS